MRDYAEKAWSYRDRLSIKDRLKVEAWREELNGRVVEAIAVYRKLVEQWPDDKELLMELVYH